MIQHNQCEAWEKALQEKNAKLAAWKLMALCLGLFAMGAVFLMGLFIWVMGQDIL